MTATDPRPWTGHLHLPARPSPQLSERAAQILTVAPGVEADFDTADHLPAKPECRELYVTEVRAGDMVWSDEDQWFYLATLDAYEHDGKVRLSYEDDLAWAEFWHDESVLVARDPAEALAWNAQRNAESVHLDGPTPDVLAELDIQHADSDGAARLDPGAAA